MTSLFYVLISTLVLSSALHEWLLFEHPIMKRTVWFILLPTYVVILITCVVSFLIPSQHVVLFIVRDIGFVVFTYSGALYGVFLITIRKIKRKHETVEEDVLGNQSI